ncbi:hypothetical protein TFLX_01156 [Thermoflexales bacterium]|nr:hypothetical protein TFLX_01156 [Thermoflexales bacterium]
MKHERFKTYVRQSRVWLLTLGIVGSLFLGIWGLGGFSSSPVFGSSVNPLSLRDWNFTRTDDAVVQQGELLAYIDAYQLPRRVVQVDLTRHPKISQFTDIDSSASGYGKNACALVAAAAALGGKEWSPLVDRIAEAAGKDYGRNTGIQPSKYTIALQAVFGGDQVKAQDNGTLGDVYRELEDGQVVIVDVKVNANSRTPSVRHPNYAHFARVLGLDLDRQEIYLENTLAGEPYWSMSLKDFVAVWLRPETTVSNILAPREAEEVTRWLVSIN